MHPPDVATAAAVDPAAPAATRPIDDVVSHGWLSDETTSVPYTLRQPAPTQWVAVGTVASADAGRHRLLVGSGRSPLAALDHLAHRLAVTRSALSDGPTLAVTAEHSRHPTPWKDHRAMAATILHLHDDLARARTTDALLTGAGYGRLVSCAVNRYSVDLIAQVTPDVVVVSLTRPATREHQAMLAAIVRQVETDDTPLVVCADDPTLGRTLTEVSRGRTVTPVHRLVDQVAAAMPPQRRG